MTQTIQTDRISTARECLTEVGQEHVLSFIDRLDGPQADQLLTQIEDIDWAELATLIKSHVLTKPEFEFPANLEPAPWFPNQPAPGQETTYQEARALGEDLIRQGKVAAFTVAGGQGTRLGWPGPKGTYPATPIRKTSLFALLAEYLLKIKDKYGVACPWYIMTSQVNDADTRAFFESNNYFGLNPDDVMIFPQGMLPAVDPNTGKVLLDTPDSLALSPNGHGGSLKALATSGALDDMKRRGVTQISYTQIDNPCVHVVDPLFIGLHAREDAQMSSKMLQKAYPKEKLGNFCSVHGRVTIIEYSDLPDELAEQRLDDGELRFAAGSIAIHMISVSFVESLNKDGFALPPHRAIKKVPYTDLATGERVDPAEPNAVKLEMFVFDALPLCECSIVFQTDRVEEFAPIKNAEGIDSAQSSSDLQIERAARWLEARGITVPRNPDNTPNATIEIQPLTAVEPADLNPNSLPTTIDPGTELVI